MQHQRVGNNKLVLLQPVLIIHRLEDNKVGYQDTAQYIEKLIQSDNKDFDIMMYPTKRHSFQDSDTWFDEYRRIYEFLKRSVSFFGSNPLIDL